MAIGVVLVGSYKPKGCECMSRSACRCVAVQAFQNAFLVIIDGILRLYGGITRFKLKMSSLVAMYPGVALDVFRHIP